MAELNEMVQYMKIVLVVWTCVGACPDTGSYRSWNYAFVAGCLVAKPVWRETLWRNLGIALVAEFVDCLSGGSCAERTFVVWTFTWEMPYWWIRRIEGSIALFGLSAYLVVYPFRHISRFLAS